MKIVSLAGSVAIALALASPADAQLLNHKDLSLATALAIATTASETCKGQGYRVTVAVVGRTGEIIAHLRGDDASPHTLENSLRKAYTPARFAPLPPSSDSGSKKTQRAARYGSPISAAVPARCRSRSART